MTKLGVAVIGAGQWGKNHVRVYSELPDAELIAVCDKNKQTAKTIAKQYKIKAYTNTTQMLKNPDIKAVNICTWSTHLAKEAQKALNQEKHVLIEKPMATTPQQAQQLVQQAKQNGLHLTVGFLMRFIPGLQHIHQTAQTNQNGQIVCATAKRVSQWPQRIGDVGVVKDTAIHDIDTMNYLFNQQPTTVYAKTGNLKNKKYEDYAHIMLTYKNAQTAFIETNWLTPYKTRTLTVTATQAIMKLDYITQEITIEKQTETTKPRLPTQEPLKAELQHFIECITQHKKPQITGEDGVKALTVATAALKSSAKNKAIKLET